ncbi:hypothetical protein [Spirulina subsalsa]|nr:hypothetical protein [Spirulina subsalsa]
MKSRYKYRLYPTDQRQQSVSPVSMSIYPEIDFFCQHDPIF